MEQADFEQILDAVRDFVRREVVPAEDEIEEKDAIPDRIRAKAAEIRQVLGDEVFDLADLGVQVILGRQGRHFHFRIDFLGRLFSALADGNKEGVCQIADRYADLLELLDHRQRQGLIVRLTVGY